MWRRVESLVAPGVVDHWMRRKVRIDQLARQAADEGFKQLIVIGAGFDSLAWRLSDDHIYPRTICADHPATLKLIGEALKLPELKRGTERIATTSVEHVPLDLVREDAVRVLSAAATFDPATATLIVIEGVLMYLAPPVVAQTLRSLASLPGGRRRLIASWMVAEPDEKIGFQGQSTVVTRWLRRSHEPMLWASTPALIPKFLLSAGWHDAALTDLSALDPEHVEGPRKQSCRVKGEWLVVANSNGTAAGVASAPPR